ncbi:hypothetical protein K435DRAFT_772331 [Dendrothele bispora CBS 962.96]|uniref:Uncharacterized protein n=1 Tax=Dendrothele bispora (strain CBS 962.96) TaxID=1314807 RepID=A0A4S8MXB1_DENBC|nr:hypothetical protein K435DRAFT_772331 [Dendrothele bispora CBS 962.96]
MADTLGADVEYLARKGSNTGYQLLSLLTPPVYTAFVLTRHGRHAFSINALLRSTWVGGLSGAVGGAGLAYARYSVSDPETVRVKRMQVAYDTSRVRAEDHSTIGAILFGVLTPALLWKRAKVLHLILGGAGIGSSIGLLTHLARSTSGDVPPKVTLPTHA